MKENGLAALAARHGLRFGTVIARPSLESAGYLRLLEGDFNTLTPANELKAYSLLDRAASEARGEFVLDFSKADAILSYAAENGFAVRGHALVWDAFMCDWFFRTGCRAKDDYLSRNAMRERLKNYIGQVLRHCETAFPGLFCAWDVVNEAVADSDKEGDQRRVRRLRDGKENPFYTHVGEDYIEFAFLCARDALTALHSSAKLLYNDYNTFVPDKREAILRLAQSVNAYALDDMGQPRRLLDGIGMQGYIGGFGKQAGCLEQRDLALLAEAVRRYAGAGLEVQITEAALRNYQNDPETAARHAAFCGQFFDTVASLADETERFTLLSVWGLCDRPKLDAKSYGYRMNGPYCGLFDERYMPKPAYEAAQKALQG